MHFKYYQMPVSQVIDSAARIIEEVRKLHDIYHAPVWLRGQEDYSWSLLPTIGRHNDFLGLKLNFNEVQERYLLHQFRRYAYSQWQRKIDDWEGLFLGRHHGLPVRIMDWTANPLVALYFSSFYTKDVCDAAVWAFVRKSESDYEPGDSIDVFTHSDPLQIKGVRIIYPFYISQRMIGQKGAFTIHETPRVPIESLTTAEFEQKDLDFVALYKWLVPAGARAALIDELEHMDVNSRRLFPDLDGLAKGLAHAEMLKIIGNKYT